MEASLEAQQAAWSWCREFGESLPADTKNRILFSNRMGLYPESYRLWVEAHIYSGDWLTRVWQVLAVDERSRKSVIMELFRQFEQLLEVNSESVAYSIKYRPGYRCESWVKFLKEQECWGDE